MDCFDGLRFLAASRTRVRILELVAGDGRVDRDVLRARLDASRTTVQRNLDALVERGWLRTTHVEYAITPAGRLAAESLDLLDERLQAADRIAPLVEYAPDAAFDFDLTALADATVVTAGPGNPYRMVNRHVDRIREATTMRSALPLVGLHAVETVHRRVTEAGVTGELVVTPDVARTFAEAEGFSGLVEETVDTGRFEVLVTDETIPFYLGLLDDRVQVGVDEDGDPRALLESTNEEVRAWAERTYEELKDGARPADL